MAGASFSILIDYDNEAVSHALDRATRAATDLREPLKAIGEALQVGTREHFTRQLDPDGRPWQPLSKRYKKRKRCNRDLILVLQCSPRTRG